MSASIFFCTSSFQMSQYFCDIILSVSSAAFFGILNCFACAENAPKQRAISGRIFAPRIKDLFIKKG